MAFVHCSPPRRWSGAVSAEAPAGPVSVVLRQEDLAVAASGEGLKARVRTRVYLGARNRYVLSLAGETIRLLTDNETVFEPGDEVALAIEPDRVRVLARRD